MKTPNACRSTIVAAAVASSVIFLLGFAVPAPLFAQSFPAMHLINDSSQDAGSVLTGPGTTFVTNFKEINDLTITDLASQVSADFVDTYPASPGNNPSYLSGFVGTTATGTGNGSAGTFKLLQTFSDGTNRTSLKFDFSVPLDPNDRIIIADTDTSEQVTIQAFDAAGQPVSLAGWTHLAFTGQTGVAPDSRWPTWNPTGGGGMTGTLTSNAGGAGMNEPVDVLIPDQAISSLIITQTQGTSGTTEAIQFLSIRAPSDFDGDGKPDFVLYNPSTRHNAVWTMDGANFVSSEAGRTIPSGHELVAVADVDHDGHPDYVLYDPSTRKTAVWYLNGVDGVTFTSAANGPKLPKGYALVALADFDGDGQLDYLLFDSSTGKTEVLYLNGLSKTSTAQGPRLPDGWSLIGTGDFNNDGKPDYVLFNSTTRNTAVWYMDGVNFTDKVSGPRLPAGWILQGVADINRDGLPDFVLVKPATGETEVWYLDDGVAFTLSDTGPTLTAGFHLIAP